MVHKDSVVPVGCLMSRSPTVNRGKVVNLCQHPNDGNFLRLLGVLQIALDLIHDARFANSF